MRRARAFSRSGVHGHEIHCPHDTCLTLTGCVHDSCRVPPPSQAQRDCHRHESSSKIEPALGYKGFKRPIPCPFMRGRKCRGSARFPGIGIARRPEDGCRGARATAFPPAQKHCGIFCGVGTEDCLSAAMMAVVMQVNARISGRSARPLHSPRRPVRLSLCGLS